MVKDHSLIALLWPIEINSLGKLSNIASFLCTILSLIKNLILNLNNIQKTSIYLQYGRLNISAFMRGAKLSLAVQMCLGTFSITREGFKVWPSEEFQMGWNHHCLSLTGLQASKRQWNTGRKRNSLLSAFG